MTFATPLLPPFRRPRRIQMTIVMLIILLYLYGPLHLISHLVSMDDNASLIVDFLLELHRIDLVILLEVIF